MAGRNPDKEGRRQAILQAALQVFARKGYEPATLEAVAREAGLAKGTLYLYFKNKEDLYFHTAVHVLESLQDSILEKSRRCSGALDRLRATALGQFDFFVRHRDTLQMLAAFSHPGLARLHKRLLAAMMEKWAGHLQRITGLVEEGQRAGAIRPDIPPGHIALAFTGMASQVAQVLVGFPLAKSAATASGPQAGQPRESAEVMADTMMRILVEGVMQR
ncbi:MAG: hypothetical protein A2V99_15230 [Spirochaetes bacterium RBG_16_67_19]|nr:MAG: hypothetical protein A2V99_15230 [Spirochaetes bacterium RBG_16_67_19]